MDSDLVQRLRDGFEIGAIDLADIMDAADEIERLRQFEPAAAVTEPMPKEIRAEVSVRIDGVDHPVPYSRSDEKRVDSPTIRDTTQPPNGTPSKGSVQGVGSVPDSRNANEPVAWAVIIPLTHGRYAVDDFFVSHSRAVEACDWRKQNTPRGAEIVPLYRHPQPTLTDAERDAVEGAIIHMETRGVWAWPATLRSLLERLK